MEVVNDTLQYLLTTDKDPPSITELSLGWSWSLCWYFGEDINEVYSDTSANEDNSFRNHIR